MLVEGPLDAIAVTLVGGGDAAGVFSLGTAFTDTQAAQIRPYLRTGKPGVIVATDADDAGHNASCARILRSSPPAAATHGTC